MKVAWSRKTCGIALALAVVTAHGQTAAKRQKSPARAVLAAWTPEVQQTLGVSASDFKAEGLNKLTQAQLGMLLNSARPDPKKHLLSCPVAGASGANVRVMLTVSGDDSSGQIAGQIRQAVASLGGVEVVDTAASADRVLNVVIQEQTMGKRTIGFTASYLTGTPCIEDPAGRKKDVELKGTLGTYTDAKGADLARDLAGMLDHDLQPLRGAGGR